jgi:hypothetical protein
MFPVHDGSEQVSNEPTYSVIDLGRVTSYHPLQLYLWAQQLILQESNISLWDSWFSEGWMWHRAAESARFHLDHNRSIFLRNIAGISLDFTTKETIQSRDWGSVTNNDGFWIGWLDLLAFVLQFFFLPRCSHTWKRAPVSEHRADLLSFLIRTIDRTPWTGD